MTKLAEGARDALTRLAEKADVRDDLSAIMSAYAVVPVHRRPPYIRRHIAVVTCGAAAVIAVVVGVVVLRGGSSSPREQPASPGQASLQWVQPHAELRAEQVAIEYGGESFTPTGAAAEATSMLLTGTTEMLTIAWQQNGVDVSWEMYLASNERQWWVESMTVLTDADGSVPGSRPSISFDDDGVRAPLGEWFSGDIDMSATSGGVTARVMVAGLQLQGFRDRGADGQRLPVPMETTPPPVLVAAPPLPADVPATGLSVTPEEWMLLTVAGETLRRECMADAGFVYPPTPDAVLVQAMGEWGPSPMQGIRRAAAARATGYHAASVGFLNGGSDYNESLSEDERNDFLAALGGDGGGCYAVAEAQLPSFDGMKSWAVTGDVRAQALEDPRVIAVLDAWGDCVEAAVGERAPTPNELSRRYAFADGDPFEGEADDHEKAVAVADAECQAQVDLETIWFTAVTDRERVAMGDRVGEYDEWARQLQISLAAAAQVLADRGIVLPSLD